MPDNHNNEIGSPATVQLSSNNGYYDAPYNNNNGSPAGQPARLAMLREWRRIIYRHKWLILSMVMIAVPFATIQAYRVKPIYQATTTIDIRPETSSLSKTGDVVLVDSNDNTKAEIVIVKSAPVIRKTVVSLNLDKNPNFLDVTTKRSVLEALTSLKGGEPEREKKLIQKAAKKHRGADAAAAEETTAEPENDQSSDDSVDILPDKQTERKRLEPYIQTLVNNLSVESVRDTRLIKISFRHTDPDIAATVANGVASNFIEYNFQTKTDRFTNTSNWLEESTRKLKAQVEMAEQKLANYSRDNHIFSLEGKENLTADKLVKLHDQVMRAETNRILKHSLYEEVKQGRVAQLPEAFADPKTADLRKGLSELAVIASQLNVKFGAKNPKLQEVNQQMATYQEQIKENQAMLEERLKADYERANREEESLKSELDRAKEAAVQQNQATIQYSVLRQDLDTAKALYTDFLNKTSQANIQRAEQYNNVRLIEEAESPGAPVGPNRKETILLGLVISLALGIGLAYLMENLNTTIRTVDDVARMTQLPMLAVIPTLTHTNPLGKHNGISGNAPVGAELGASSVEPKAGSQELQNGTKKEGKKASSGTELRAAGLKDIDDSGENINHYSEKPVLADSMKVFSAAAEAYRMLRTSILLSTAGHPPKTMMVTSGQPGDGKTTTVFNIALALTQLKAEVVIVDCDMRKPRIHKLLQISKCEGISTILTSGGDPDKFIKRTPVPHLSVLPCGFVPPNPSELISSESMKELLRSLAERFDYVVIDSPPLLSVTDPLILSTLVDGVILVVKSGKSKSELVRRACQDLFAVGARVLGVTLNSLDIRKDGYDYYRYYRSYGDYIDQDLRKRSGP